MNTGRMVHSFLLAVPVALALLALGGCARSDPARFYLLEPTVPVAAQPGDGSEVGLWVERLPDYLRRPELATRLSPHEVGYDDFSRWATPLDDSVPGVLAQNLARLEGSGRVQLYPWHTTKRPQRVIHIQITRFDADSTGTVHLAARVDAGDTWRQETVELQAASTRAVDIVAAQSEALAELARRLVAR